MVYSVGFDVYMSQIMKMKFLTLTTSSGLVLGPTKSGQAKICSYEHALQDYHKFSRGRAGTLRNKVLYYKLN